MQSSIERAALKYLKRHWSVLPMQPRGKRPAVRWLEFQQRCAERKEVQDWFRRCPKCNVGIVTGAISGIVVLDIDPKHDGDASLAELTRQYGPLPPSVEATTGGGGRHIYFAHPGGIVRNQVGVARGIDIRGDGGCVVAPPSVHASGKPYVWAPGHAPEQLEPARMPAWLLDEADGAPQRRGHPLEYWRDRLREGVPEGERNNTIASLTGHLLWHGVDPQVVLELLLCWNRIRCRPPLPDDEVVRTVNSITRLHEHPIGDAATL